MLMDKRSKEQMPKAASNTALEWGSNCRTPSIAEERLLPAVPHFTIHIMFSPQYGACDGLESRFTPRPPISQVLGWKGP